MTIRYRMFLVHHSKTKTQWNLYYQYLFNKYNIKIHNKTNELLGYIIGVCIFDENKSNYYNNTTDFEYEDWATGPFVHSITSDLLIFKQPIACNGNIGIWYPKSTIIQKLNNNKNFKQYIQEMQYKYVNRIFKDKQSNEGTHLAAFSVKAPMGYLILTGIKKYENRKKPLIIFSNKKNKFNKSNDFNNLSYNKSTIKIQKNNEINFLLQKSFKIFKQEQQN